MWGPHFQCPALPPSSPVQECRVYTAGPQVRADGAGPGDHVLGGLPCHPNTPDTECTLHGHLWKNGQETGPGRGFLLEGTRQASFSGSHSPSHPARPCPTPRQGPSCLSSETLQALLCPCELLCVHVCAYVYMCVACASVCVLYAHVCAMCGVRRTCMCVGSCVHVCEVCGGGCREKGLGTHLRLSCQKPPAEVT